MDRRDNGILTFFLLLSETFLWCAKFYEITVCSHFAEALPQRVRVSGIYICNIKEANIWVEAVI
jgi:hypothetical protein